MVWNVLSAPIKAALTLATSIVVARMLGPQDYGSYAILLSILATLGQYTDLGINRSLPRYVPQAEVRFGRSGVEALLRDVLAVKGILTLATLGAVNLFAGWFLSAFDLGTANLVWIRIVTVIFAVEVFREIASRVLASYFRQKLTNAVEMITLAAHPLLAALALGYGFGISGALAAMAAVSLLGGMLLWLGAARVILRTPERAPVTDPHETSRAMMPHAGTIYFLLVTKYFAELSFVVFLLAWAGMDKAAIARFAIAYKIVGMIMNLLAIPLQSVQVPLMARMDAAERPEGFAQAYTLLLKYLIFVLGPGACLMVLVAPEMVTLLYGDAYGGTESLIRILVPLFALETLLSLSSNVLMIKGNYREMMGLRWASLLGGVVITAAALRESLVLVALAVGLVRVLIAVVGYSIAARRHGLAFPAEFTARVLAAGSGLTVMAWAALRFAPPGLPALLLAGGAGVLGFVVTFRLLGGFNADEKKLLQHLPVPGLERLLRWI